VTHTAVTAEIGARDVVQPRRAVDVTRLITDVAGATQEVLHVEAALHEAGTTMRPHPRPPLPQRRRTTPAGKRIMVWCVCPSSVIVPLDGPMVNKVSSSRRSRARMFQWMKWYRFSWPPSSFPLQITSMLLPFMKTHKDWTLFDSKKSSSQVTSFLACLLVLVLPLFAYFVFASTSHHQSSMQSTCVAGIQKRFIPWTVKNGAAILVFHRQEGPIDAPFCEAQSGV